MNYRDLNDYELLYLVKDEDDTSLKIILKKYEPIIVAYAKKYIKAAQLIGYSMEDLIQEGNIGLIRAVQKYQDGYNANFYTFAVLCIRRQIVSTIKSWNSSRQQVWQQVVSMDENIPNTDFKILDFFEDHSFSPINNLERNLQNIKLIEFKNRLSFLQGNIFELRYNGFSYREIMELLDIEMSQVLSSIRYIKRKIVNI